MDLADLEVNGAVPAASAGKAAAPISRTVSHNAAARSASPIAALPVSRRALCQISIGRRAACDLATDDPVPIGSAGHRPFRVFVQRLLVPPLFYQKYVLVVTIRQHHIELKAPVVAARAPRMPAPHSMNWLRCPGLTSNSTTIMTWFMGVPFLRHFEASSAIARRGAPRGRCGTENLPSEQKIPQFGRQGYARPKILKPRLLESNPPHPRMSVLLRSHNGCCV